jgi:hypothetical protein
MEFLSSFFFIVVKSKFCFHFLLWLHCYCCATCFSSSRISHPASGTGPLLPAVFSQPIFIARVSSARKVSRARCQIRLFTRLVFCPVRKSAGQDFSRYFVAARAKALVFF